MAIIHLEVPFAEVHGTFVRNGIINRQKKYKDDNGRVIFQGRQEAYAVRHPRDYKKNPPQGEELRNINIFREANRLTTELIRLDQELKAAQASDSPETVMKEILQDPNKAAQASLLADYKEKKKKQIRKPDPQSPTDPNTHRRKQYHALNTFIRALIYQDLKAHKQCVI